MSRDSSELVASTYMRNTTIAAVVIALGWHVGEDLPAMIIAWAGYRWPAAVAAAWLAYAGIAGVAALVLLRGDRPIRYAWALATAALVLGVVVAAAAHGQLMTLASWAWGAVGWLGVMLFWRRSMAHLVCFLGVNAVLGLGVLVVAGTLDRISIARYLMVVTGSGALQLAFAGGARALRAAADWTAAASAAHAETLTAQRTAEEVHRMRQRRFQALQHTTAHILAALADGRALPSDPSVQRSCAMEAARLRRLFAETDDLPDPLVHELEACADVAERRGVAVDLAVIGSLPGVPVNVRRALAEPPIELLSAAKTSARITVAGLGDQVVIGVVADADLARVDSGHGPDVAVSWFREGERLWVETRWPDRSPSPSSKTIQS